MPYHKHRAHQEVTVPVSFSHREGAPGNQDRREARLITAIAIGSGLALGLLCAVALQIVKILLEESRPPQNQVCTPGSCGRDRICRSNGHCESKTDDIRICNPHDACGTPSATCECQGPSMACADNKCVPTIAPAKSACENPQIQGLLARVAKKCSGDLGKCPPSQLQEFALADEDFDEVIRLVPETITVHFPEGDPNPDVYQSEYYRQRMKELDVIGSLDKAKVILIIGRSSKGGSRQKNLGVSRARAQKTVDLLTEAADIDTRDKIKTAKLLVLGNRKIIQPSFFEKSYRNRLIAWSEPMESDLLGKLSDIDSLSKKEKKWTRDAINQVAIIVPIACDLPGTTPETTP